MLYLVSIVILIPPLARLNGRVSISWFATAEIPLNPVNPGYCLLARNYVRIPVRQLLGRVAGSISHQFPGTNLQYLDANFPFMNGFPLLPHLSHHDGRNVDLAFMYQDAETGQPLSEPPSSIGYWAYAAPKSSEVQPCRKLPGWLRWDFDWFQPSFDFAEIDLVRTKYRTEK